MFNLEKWKKIAIVLVLAVILFLSFGGWFGKPAKNAKNESAVASPGLRESGNASPSPSGALASATPSVGIKNASSTGYSVLINGEFYELTLQSSPPPDSKCGDGFCDYEEDCASCASDCACGAGKKCNTLNGVCYAAEACGDGNCSASERGN